MSHGGSEKPTGTEPSLGGSEERQKLIREVTAMRKQLLLFQKNEERQTELVKKLESRVDELETEKYREVAVVSSLKIDLNLKESENKRLGQRIDQLSKQCTTLTERYTVQKQKIDTLVQHEKEFFKALQEVIDYYYDSLIGFSKFHLKSMYKLMVGEQLNVQTELKEDIIARHSKLAILNTSLEIPTVKISKKVLFKNIHQRVAFFNDLEFDRMQLTFDRILDGLKRSGLKIEANDMNMSVLIDSKQSSRFRKGGSNHEDELNESVGDINTSQTMFLSDLEKSDLHLPGNSGKGETFGSLGECLKALKDRIKAKSGAIEPDKQGLDTAEMDMVSRVIRDMSEMVDFLNSNINPGNEEKKLSSKMGSEGASTHLGDSSLSGFNITAVNHDISPAIDENVSTATISQLVQGMLILIEEFRTKIGAFGENNSVQLSDLEHLQKLLQEKDETNSNWNKVQVAMARLAKKINFMGEFIKEKQRILENKQLLLEKAKLTEGELVETVKSLAKELSSSPDSLSSR